MKMHVVGALAAVGATAATAGYAQTTDTRLQQFCAANRQACEGGTELARKMVGCLQLPAGAPASFSLLAVVVIENAEAKASRIDFKTLPSPWEQQAAVAVTDAITACEPYAELSGPVVFLVTPALVQAP